MVFVDTPAASAVDSLVLAHAKPASFDPDLLLSTPIFPNTIRDDSHIAPKSDQPISLQEPSSRAKLLRELRTFSTNMNVLFSATHEDSNAPDEGPDPATTDHGGLHYHNISA